MNPSLQYAAFNLACCSCDFFWQFEHTVLTSTDEAEHFVESDRKLAFMKASLGQMDAALSVLTRNCAYGDLGESLQSAWKVCQKLQESIIGFLLPDTWHDSEWASLTRQVDILDECVHISREFRLQEFGDSEISDDFYESNFLQEKKRLRFLAFQHLLGYPESLNSLADHFPDSMKPFFMFGLRLSRLHSEIALRPKTEKPSDKDLYHYVLKTLKPELVEMFDQCSKFLPGMGENVLYKIDDEDLENSLADIRQVLQKRLGQLASGHSDSWFRELPDGVSMYGKNVLLENREKCVLLHFCRVSSPQEYKDFVGAWPSWKLQQNEKQMRTCLTNIRNAIRAAFKIGNRIDPVPNVGGKKHAAWELKRSLLDPNTQH